MTALPVGRQQIVTDKVGFKRLVTGGINLIVGQELVVNLQLELGELTQEVTLSAQEPLVNTTPAEVSGFVGERAGKGSAAQRAKLGSLVALNPGTTNYALKSANTTTSEGNTFTVAGRRPMDNIVLLNGIEYTGASLVGVTPGGVSGGLLGIDAVREFNS